MGLVEYSGQNRWVILPYKVILIPLGGPLPEHYSSAMCVPSNNTA